VPNTVQVWSQSGYLLARRSDFWPNTKAPLSRDLWPRPWAQPGCAPTWRPSCSVQVWSRSSHFCRSRSDLRIKVYRHTDTWTDGHTDKRQRPGDCI